MAITPQSPKVAPKWHRRWWARAVAVAAVLLVAAGIYFGTYYPAHGEAVAALADGQRVSVTRAEGVIALLPDEGGPDTGFIFYPGGKVDERAYAPALLAIARRGYAVFLVQMPFHLAVFRGDAAAAVIARHPQISHWAVGGHSLGGVMAADWAAKNTDKVQGLVLWASYPTADMTQSGLKALTLLGTLDGVISQGKWSQAKALLPKGYQYVAIGGGNHAGFGDYGPQSGDGVAAIPAQEQQQSAVDATSALLESLK